MGTGLSGAGSEWRGGENAIPSGLRPPRRGQTQAGTLPSRAKALLAPQPPGPGRGSGRSCRRCRIPEKPPPPAAGASRRWQTGRGRGRLCSPRGAGDRCQPGPPRPRLRGPPGPPGSSTGNGVLSSPRHKNGDSPPRSDPHIPPCPPHPSRPPGSPRPPERGRLRSAASAGRREPPVFYEPGTSTGHRNLVPRPGTGALQRNRSREPCTKTFHRSFAQEPFSGALHRGRAGSAGPHCGAGPCRFPHIRRGTGETKIPTIERKAQLRHRDRHPRHSRSRSRCRRLPRSPASPSSPPRGHPPFAAAAPAATPVPPVAEGPHMHGLGPAEPPPGPSVVPASSWGFPPEKRVPGGRWGRSRRKRIRGSGESGERRGPTGGSGAAADPFPGSGPTPAAPPPGPAPPLRPRRSVIPGRTGPHDRERSAWRCPVPAAVGRRRAPVVLSVSEPTAVKKPERPFSTAAADSSAPGTGPALPGLHRAPGSATGYRERHRTSAIPGLPWAPAPSTGAGASGTPTGASSRHKHRRWHRRWHRAPSRGSIGKQHREPAPAPGPDRLPGAAAEEPALAAAAAQPCRGHRHRGPVPAPGTEPRAPAPRGAQRCHRRWTEQGPPHRIPVPLLVRGGHRLPGPGGDTRGARPRYIGAAAPRAAHSGGGSGAGTAGGGTGGARPGAPRCPRGRKESGEGGGVNIEYLLIAVEGRSVITASPRSHRRRLVTADESWRGRDRERAAGSSGGAGGGRPRQGGEGAGACRTAGPPAPRPERRRRRAGSGRRGRGPGTGTGERDRRPARGGLAYRWP
ncbi:collagen alpha-1(III) chain-like [Melozone crissalis]|uniref:collagen alpha-1(III) chain-like n=1 Tax=Melozone crissalis TaxID=40204 RepID=UPI0023DA31A4|nr:collagen alpha-1(III) chain-like [Melozone crissalis]